MQQALDRTDEIGIVFIEVARALTVADHQVTPHAGSQVDDDIGVLGPNALHDITVVVDIADAFTGFGFTHMAMDDGSAGRCCLKG